MSNLETAPPEVTNTSTTTVAGNTPMVLDARAVPLGGPRAMTVRRTLPQRACSLVGAWCFADHYGPDDVSTTGGIRVAGHPHTGLQTVSWLFQDEVEHRDTLGTHAYVKPGELNLMTAGFGIAHSEYSTPTTQTLHGVQLWVALPERHRFVAPAFEHYAPPVVDIDGARALVFLGELAEHSSPVRPYTPLLGAEITLHPGQELRLEADPTFEHGVLVDVGEISIAGTTAGPGQLVYLPTGADTLTLTSARDGEARVLLLGGQPLGEQIVMWWNFIGRSHEDIAAYREQWERERAGDTSPGNRRYGPLPTQWRRTLPAPALPGTRLRARGQGV